MSQLNPTKGRVHTAYQIECGNDLCATWDEMRYRTRDEAMRDWRSQGWAYTRKHGWLCPSCAGDVLERVKAKEVAG